VFRFRSHRTFFLLASSVAFGAMVAFVPSVAPQVQSTSTVTSRVLTGIDLYESMNSEPLSGKRIGLITNQTGVDSRGLRTSALFSHMRDVKLIALFSPEHGIEGKAEGAVASATDAANGVPVYSLYGETRRPTDAMLKGIDVLIFDVQDAGVRFYTYVTTMAYCMEEAAKHHITFIVFDRPDPLGGNVIEGPMLDAGRLSFTGYFPMPVRYGMTMGELARMFNAENKIGADLEVMSMRGWKRSMAYDETGLRWIPPSPNLRTINAAFLYPGIEILQAGGVSVGRGTEAPFEMIGAPWIRADEFATVLNGRKIPGVSFAPGQFTPSADPYGGQVCQGVTISITDRGSLRAMRVGLEVADALHKMYPERFHLEKMIELLGSQATIERLGRGDGPADIVEGWSTDLDRFRRMREKYLLYE
jgi:uncharacterized protein YbbC (DUF1343 family)